MPRPTNTEILDQLHENWLGQTVEVSDLPGSIAILSKYKKATQTRYIAEALRPAVLEDERFSMVGFHKIFVSS